MKRIVLFFVLVFSAASITEQDKIAVFVYSTTKLTQPTNALRSHIEGALNSSAEKAYIVVDRTDEFRKILKEEYGYQEEGYVSNNDLVAAGQQLGANKVCGVVITDYGNEGYFIECKILDVKDNRIERIAKYPTTTTEKIDNLGIAASREVANSIASQLNLLSIDQEKRNEEIRKQQEEIRKQQEEIRKQHQQDSIKQERKKLNDDWKEHYGNYIAWNIIGRGYPWNLTDGIVFRHGGIVGIGAYFDIGYDGLFSTDDPVFFHYRGGLKFFLYKGVSLDGGYGTIVRNKPFEQNSGFFLHASYNLVTDLESGYGFFLGLSAGASYDLKNKVYAPSIMLKMGVAWKNG